MSQPNQPVLEIHSGIVLKGQLSMSKDVVLTGKFEGDLQTLGCLTVAKGGVIRGSINAGSLVLEPGYDVTGPVKVGPPPKTAPARVVEESKPGVESFWPGSLRKLKDFALGRK